MAHPDVVVIGAGFGGLASALRLAELGADVVLCETLRYPGGCASTFTRSGYQFEAGATLFSGLGDGQLFSNWNDKWDLGVRFDPLDPLVELRTADWSLAIPPDPASFLRRFSEVPGADSEALRAFFGTQRRVADALWKLFEDPSLLPPLSGRSVLRHLKRSWSYSPVLRWMGRPLSDVVSQHDLAGWEPLRVYLDAVSQITVQASSAEAEAPFAMAAVVNRSFCLDGWVSSIEGLPGGVIDGATLAPIIDLTQRDDAVAELTGIGRRLVDLVYEHEGATWLRATQLGLDRDRVIVKGSGEPTYLLPDIAYHREKLRRGFDQVIDVQGADHLEQFPFVTSAVGALDLPADRIELVMHQFVTLTQGGDQVKQSTRRATYVTVDWLLGEVGIDVFRYFMVQRRAESHLDFDLELARETDWKKNPAYYVQYANARTHGIERKAAELGVQMPNAASVDADALALPEEIAILRKIAEFPEVVERAGETREPHHLCYYARDVAALWNPYLQDGARHRILSEDVILTNARLGLALAVRIVLSSATRGLNQAAPASAKKRIANATQRRPQPV